jgi:hypothetical protein
MAVGETMHDAQREEKVIHRMPAGQAAVYGSLQDAYAQSLLLAGPALQKLLIENQNYLDQLVWASWQGKSLDARDDLFSDVLAAMHEEVVELPQQ